MLTNVTFDDNSKHDFEELSTDEFNQHFCVISLLSKNFMTLTIRLFKRPMNGKCLVVQFIECENVNYLRKRYCAYSPNCDFQLLLIYASYFTRYFLFKIKIANLLQIFF